MWSFEKYIRNEEFETKFSDESRLEQIWQFVPNFANLTIINQFAFDLGISNQIQKLFKELMNCNDFFFFFAILFLMTFYIENQKVKFQQ